MTIEENILKNLKFNMRKIEIFLLVILFLYILNDWYKQKELYLKLKVDENIKNVMVDINENLFYGKIINYIEVMEKISNDEKTISFLKENNEEAKKELENIFYGVQKIISSDNIYVMDKKGDVILSLDKSFYNNNYSFRPYFSGALKGEKIVYPALGVTTNIRGIYLSMPLYFDEEIKYVFVIKLNMKNIENKLNKYKEKIYIVSPEGVIFSTNQKDALFKYIYAKTQNEIENIEKTKQYGNKKLVQYNYLFEQEYIEIEGKKHKIVKEKNLYGWKSYILFDVSETIHLKDEDKAIILKNLTSRLFIFFIVFSLYLLILYILKKQHTIKELFTIIEETPVSVVITDISGKITYVNDKFTKLTGYEKKEVIGQNPKILKSGYQDEIFYKNLWKDIKNGNEWHGELCNKKKNGDIYWEKAIIIPVKDISGKIYRYLAVKEDVTEKHNYMEKLKYYAEIDELTGIYNRRTGMHILQEMISENRTHKQTLSICFADLDNLKYANDNYGHQFGDEMIKKFVETVKKNLRKKDIVCRVGGDEFIILLSECNIQKTEYIWARIIKEYKEINDDKNYPFLYSVSHGIVECNHNEYLELDEIIAIADKKMYEEKNSKK